jgi:SUN family beta-glucosidase
MSTSAQYYVNPKGVGVSDGCKWGSPGTPWGNYAPVNLGVGTKDGATWISIMANKPTTDAILDFDIEIVGDNLGGACSYSGGVFTSLTGSNSDGCTVS